MPLDDPGWSTPTQLPPSGGPPKRPKRSRGLGHWLSHPLVLVAGAVLLVAGGALAAELRKDDTKDDGSKTSASASSSKRSSGSTKDSGEAEAGARDDGAKDDGSKDDGNGGDEPVGGESTAVPISDERKEYIEQADEICTRYVTEILDLQGRNQYDDVPRLMREEIDALRALEQPDGDEALLGQWFSNLDSMMTFLMGPQPKTAQPYFDKAIAIADQYGMHACGTSKPASTSSTASPPAG